MKRFQHFAMSSVEDAFRELGSGPQGISTVEALRRRAAGANREIRAPVPSWLSVLLRQVLTTLNALLVGAAVIAAALGEPTDAATILVILCINTGLGFFQEYRSERAVNVLRTYLAGRARVRRGGAVLLVPHEELVPGDVVLLAAGDRVPADLRVMAAPEAGVDESALSGESAPVRKDFRPAAVAPRDPGAAEQIVFSGTTLVAGSIEGVVFANGVDTEFGTIAGLAITARRRSAFEENVQSFSRFIIRIVVVALALLLVAKLFLEGNTDRIGEFLLFSLALAISVVPEALPVVMTITFSRGALHLARRHVIVKRLSAIEDLGQIEVLCTDKTGTITENRMRVTEVFSLNQEECLREAGEGVATPEAGSEPRDPFERAIWNRLAPAFRSALGKRPLLGSIPFSHDRRRSSTIVPAANQTGARLILRGAPEDVLPLAASEGGRAIGADRRREILEAFRGFGRCGYRTLAVASRPIAAAGPWTAADERALEWQGLIAFEDPLKPSATSAIRLAERLRVRVKILTGDSREVAGAVAHTLGIITRPEDVIGGEELDALSAPEFSAAARRHDVFARVTPEQKYRIIEALQRDVAVGFLGEGINDAPALKLASVALAVPSAADLSKEAADAIILDRSLQVIVDGIREGRAIVANVAKYIRSTLAGNFGNFISIAVFSLFLPFLPMLPVQILLANLLTDLPFIAVSADRVDIADLGRPHRLNIRDLVFSAMILGLVSAVFYLIFFALYHAAPPAVVQSLWFIFSILAELLTSLVIRTSLPAWRAAPPAPILVWLVVAAGAVALGLPYLAIGERVFHLVMPSGHDLVIVALLVAGVVGMTEVVKLQLQKYMHEKQVHAED